MKSYLTFDQFQLRKEIPNLDGLRAISIFLVILHHCTSFGSMTFLENLRLYGNIGVNFFFIISGFLITTLALRELDFTGKFSWKNFYIRRSLRIFPLYYAFLGFASFLIFVVDIYPPERRAEFAARLPSYLFYYSNLVWKTEGPLSLLWSLAVEEQFYLIFSVIFFIFSKKWSAFLFIFLTVLYLSPLQTQPTSQILILLKTAFWFQGPILFGVVLAYLLNNKKCYDFIAPILCNPWVLTTASTAAMFVLLNSMSTVFNPILNLILAVIVGGCSLSPVIPILGGPVMSYIGKISYGMYLFHIMVLFGLRKFLTVNPFILFTLGTIITIGIASLSYKYFETPFLKLKKKLST